MIKTKKTMIIIFLLTTVFLSVFSMPPHSRIMDGIRSGEIVIPDFPRTERWMAQRDYTGSYRAVVLLADFPDKNRSVDIDFFNELLNGDNVNFKQKYPGNTNVSSVKEYYLFESNDTFEIDFDVYGWFEMPQDYAYYVGSNNGLGSYPNNSQKLVEDAINAADPVVDFSRYAEGSRVDFLLVVHAGIGAEFSGASGEIWSHQWSITPQTRDGVTLSPYSMQPEYWVEPYDMTIGVYCHELGHLIFGLRDLYDTAKNSYGIGYWGLMGAGSWNDEKSIFGENEYSGYGGAPAELTAWSKLRIGWEESVPVSDETENFVVSEKIHKYENENNPQEYFLYEFKESNPYNDYLPGRNGLMIYRIDDSKYSNTQPWIPGKDMNHHYWVAVIQKDNNWSLERYENRGDPSDLFYTGDRFNQFSAPENFFYSGDNGIPINRIETTNESALIITNKFDFEIYIHELPGTGKLRVFLSKEPDATPSVTDSEGTPLTLHSMSGKDLFYFELESDSSDTTFINNIPVSFF